MKNQLQDLALSIAAAVVLTSCAGLGSMVSKYDKMVKYEVKPSPLEMHGDSVSVNISGKYDPKYFAKKVELTITPTIKYNGGEKELKPVNVKGEKVTAGSGTTVVFKEGGSFSYADKATFVPEMKNAELVLKIQGKKGSKTKEFPAKKIADGTIVTPLLVLNDDKPMVGKDKFMKTFPVNITTEIFFLINQSDLRSSELNGTSVSETKKMVDEKRKLRGFIFKGASVSAYASPDGELTINEHLAENRAKVTSRYLSNYANSKGKDKSRMVPGADAEGFWTTKTTAEDWDGFKSLMQQSSVKDKELILRVLEMYPDGDKRESEIKNLAATYQEVAEQILPKLRRSVTTWNCEQQSRTDEEISKLAVSAPDSLSVEEILYAATLTSDVNAKLSIYKSAERIYANDWRTFNNVAYCNILLNKPADAQAALDKAKALDANAAEINNNLGILARWNGDRKAAMELYKKAGVFSEVNHNMGIVNIRDGKYSEAVNNFGSETSFNAALAKVLSGNADAAMTSLDASPEKDDAIAYYLKAIIGARKGAADMVVTNLKLAVEKDASLKEKAKEDLEFLKMRDNADFKALVG